MQEQQHKSLGKYQIKKKIGAGGMGSVYLATDVDLNRTVALKVLPREKAENPTLVKRFRAEAQAAAQLRHDNVVTVYEAGEVDGYLYIALEYVEGIDVYELICKRGIVPVKRSVEIVKQVASALQHAGTMGIIHRDIKPSNLLIRRDGTCKLTDLGLARSIDETTETDITRAGTTVGTVDYMSPEQARDSKSADIRSDIYSLGCTWFHMVAGKPPFAEGSVTNKLHAHAVKPPPDPRDENPSIPEGVVATMHRMMAKAQGDRYQSPTELLADLNRTNLTHTAVSTDVLAGLAVDEQFGEEEEATETAARPVTRIERYAKYDKKKKKKTRAAATTANDEPSVAESGGQVDASSSEATDPKKLPPRTALEPTESEGFDWEVLKYVGVALGVVAMVVLVWSLSARLGTTFSGSVDAEAAKASAEQRRKALARKERPKRPARVPAQRKPPPQQEVEPEEDGTLVADQSAGIGRLGEQAYLPEWASPLAASLDFEKPESTRGLRVITIGSGAAQDGDLAAALGQLKGGGSLVKLAGKGPFYLSPRELNGAGRVIIAGDPQSRPVVYCTGEDANSGDAVLSISGGSLTLLDLDIVMEATEFAANGELSFIKADNCRVVMRDCSLSVRGKRPGQTTAFNFGAESPAGCTALIERVLVRANALTLIHVAHTELDVVASNSLFALGDAPLVRFSNVASNADSSGSALEPASRRLRLLSCTASCNPIAFDLSHDRRSQTPPRAQIQLVNSLVSSPVGGEGATLVTLGQWPREVAPGPDFDRPQYLKFEAHASCFNGWSTLVDWQRQTASDAAAWERTWGGSIDEVLFSPDAWPSSVSDIADVSQAQFDASTVPGLQIKATDGGTLGCLPATLHVPDRQLVARAVALHDRPAWRPPEEETGPVVNVDVGEKDLGKVIGRDDWESGTVFELTGEGAEFTTPIVVEGKSLKLKFPDATENTLTLSSKAVTRRSPMISVVGGSIEIENGSFKIPASKRATSPGSFLRVIDGSFALRNCYVRGPMLPSPHFRGLIEWSSAAPAESRSGDFGLIENSYLASIVAAVRAEMLGDSLLINNSVLAGVDDLLVFGGATTGGALDIRKSTLSAGNAHFTVDTANLQEGRAGLLRFFVDETVFGPPVTPADEQSRPVVLSLNGPGSPLALVDWWGNRNGYAVELTEYIRQVAGESPETQSFDSVWIGVWGQERVNQPIAGSGDVLLEQPLPAPSNLKPGSFLLHSVSKAVKWAEGGGPIGADLENVRGEPIQRDARRDDAKRPKTNAPPKPRTPKRNRF